MNEIYAGFRYLCIPNVPIQRTFGMLSSNQIAYAKLQREKTLD